MRNWITESVNEINMGSWLVVCIVLGTASRIYIAFFYLSEFRNKAYIRGIYLIGQCAEQLTKSVFFAVLCESKFSLKKCTILFWVL